MINSVSYNTNCASTRNAQNKGVMPDLSRKNLSFGYGEQDNSLFDNVKYGFASLTSSLLGIVGFNAALIAIQDIVNGKILIGKINEHYTKKINDNEKLTSLADEMLKTPGLETVHREFGGTGEAFYTSTGIPKRKILPNTVVIGADKGSALFHEIGHAIIENKTTFLKFLQDHRGRYMYIALALYALMSQNKKQSYNPYEEQDQSFGSKVKNFLSRSTLLVPLLAFSPELITEAMASKYGLKFLKGKVEKPLYNNIKNSYRACFGTYLFIPISIILMEVLQNSLEKGIQKHRYKKMMSEYNSF